MKCMTSIYYKSCTSVRLHTTTCIVLISFNIKLSYKGKLFYSVESIQFNVTKDNVMYGGCHDNHMFLQVFLLKWCIIEDLNVLYFVCCLFHLVVFDFECHIFSQYFFHIRDIDDTKRHFKLWVFKVKYCIFCKMMQ